MPFHLALTIWYPRPLSELVNGFHRPAVALAVNGHLVVRPDATHAQRRDWCWKVRPSDQRRSSRLAYPQHGCDLGKAEYRRLSVHATHPKELLTKQLAQSYTGRTARRLRGGDEHGRSVGR